MDQLDPDSTFNSLEVDDYEVAPLPKVVDKRGYMYLIEDSVFPGYIKIGRTVNLKKRLAVYNSDRPYNTVKVVAVTRMFEDVNHVEKKILEYLYENTAPSTLSREWFKESDRATCLQLFSDAEDAFE